VLRDYERLWAAKDGAGLARIFAPDGFVMSSSTPPVRGREAIQTQYSRTAGGALRLRAFAYNTADTVGYIIGGYRYDQQDADIGKFILAIKRERGGPWLIAADIDNGNSR
jgi:ketosteroid isomerase-like protein